MKYTSHFLALCASCIIGLSACSNNATDHANNINKNNTKVFVKADIIVDVDVTNPASSSGEMHDLWQVANRIAPKNGVKVRPDLKVNTIRMIGGIAKKVDGKRVPDLAYDTAFFDEKKQDYVYNFSVLTHRIDKIIQGGNPLYQIVLDQPPWAFQRGYTFIPDDQKDEIHFREKERMSHYGNSLPPYDKAEYFEYIQALMHHLIDTYTLETVQAWRFRIGTEIETPEHWYGTEQEFVEHFGNTAKAVRSVLPNALIGVHTRPPGFVYIKKGVTNYKGEVIKSFSDAITEYAFDNNIRIDYWGSSDYPIMTVESTRDAKDKYKKLFEPFTQHPKWQNETTFVIEEFLPISKIGQGYLIDSDTAEADTLVIAMTDELSQRGIDQIFQWNQRVASHELWRTKALKDMAGKKRYLADITSTGEEKAKNIGAIVASQANNETIDVVLYNYDPAGFETQNTQNIDTKIVTKATAGTTYFYRTRLASNANKKFYAFMSQPNADKYLGKVAGFNKYGNAETVLSDEGKIAYENFEHNNPSVWGNWQQAQTLPQAENAIGSVIHIQSELPLFSFEKIEITFTKL